MLFVYVYFLIGLLLAMYVEYALYTPYSWKYSSAKLVASKISVFFIVLIGWLLLLILYLGTRFYYLYLAIMEKD